MPAYDYRCRECDTQFEVRRSLGDDAVASPACPAGHGATTRIWSGFAVTGLSGAAATPAAPPASGGCCGGGCCG